MLKLINRRWRVRVLFYWISFCFCPLNSIILCYLLLLLLLLHCCQVIFYVHFHIEQSDQRNFSKQAQTISVSTNLHIISESTSTDSAPATTTGETPIYIDLKNTFSNFFGHDFYKRAVIRPQRTSDTVDWILTQPKDISKASLIYGMLSGLLIVSMLQEVFFKDTPSLYFRN